MSDERNHEFTRGRHGWIRNTDLSSTDPVATRGRCANALGWSFQPAFPTARGEYHLIAYTETGGGAIGQTSPSETE